jgi:hypothetical protein
MGIWDRDKFIIQIMRTPEEDTEKRAGYAKKYRSKNLYISLGASGSYL